MSADGDTGEGDGLGAMKTQGNWAKADIPERIVKKLARIAKLEYRDTAREGGGGLCLGIEGAKRRRKALMILGALLGELGAGSSDRAVEGSGSTWLDVMAYREDAEYARLWETAMAVRREVAAARLEDRLWGRAVNGYDSEEAKNTRDGIELVKVKRYNDGLSVAMLKGLGYMGRRDAVAGEKKRKAAKSRADEIAAALDAQSEENRQGEEDNAKDTVLFPDRRTAFEVMGAPAAPAAGTKKEG